MRRVLASLLFFALVRGGLAQIIVETNDVAALFPKSYSVPAGPIRLTVVALNGDVPMNSSGATNQWTIRDNRDGALIAQKSGSEADIAGAYARWSATISATGSYSAIVMHYPPGAPAQPISSITLSVAPAASASTINIGGYTNAISVGATTVNNSMTNNQVNNISNNVVNLITNAFNPTITAPPITSIVQISNSYAGAVPTNTFGVMTVSADTATVSMIRFATNSLLWSDGTNLVWRSLSDLGVNASRPTNDYLSATFGTNWIMFSALASMTSYTQTWTCTYTQIYIKAQGGGGGGQAQNTANQGGAGGRRLVGPIATTVGETFKIIVGKGGLYNNTTNRSPAGGGKGVASSGCGGGASVVWRLSGGSISNPLVVAGGGAGGGNNATASGGSGGPDNLGGGSSSATYTGGSTSNNLYLQGGDATNINQGAGGGGYYSGLAAGVTNGACGGGGGSNYGVTSEPFGYSLRGTDNNDPDIGSGYGAAGTFGASGQDGFVKIYGWPP